MIPQQRLQRGILVALEGIDGAGKSLQVRSLEAIFQRQGYDTLSIHEPTDSPWGRRIRELKRSRTCPLSPSQELDLFLLDRRYDVATHIKPALAARKLVLMDRYYFSTIAYQGALGIDPERIRRLNEAFAPVPDLVFILLIPPSEALERIRQARGRADDAFEQEDYLQRVDKVFRTVKGPDIHPVAADQPPDVVTAALHQKIQALLNTCSPSPPQGGG